MNKILCMFVLGGIVCGCVNTREVGGEKRPDRKVVETVVANSEAEQPAVSETQLVNKKVSVPGRATALVRPLRVLVSIDDGNAADAPSVCKRTLQANVEGALARAGFRTVYARPAEILVSGALRGKKVNARGTREAWKGDIDLQVTRAPEVNSVSGQTQRDIVDHKRFDAKSGDARSSDDAQKILGDRLGPQVAEFAAASVNRIGNQMKCVELTVVNAWQPQDAAGYPTLFTQKVRNLKGVYSCRIVTTDNATRTMKAEVVYDAAEYPDGFMNRLYTLPELNIVR